jgi:hypothetical protein
MKGFYALFLLLLTFSSCTKDEASSAAQVSKPEKPTGLSAEVVKINEISLNWDANSGIDVNFKVERRSEGGSFSRIGSVIKSNFYSDTTCLPGEKYIYRVCAFNQKTTSEYSNEVTIRALGLPSWNEKVYILGSTGNATNAVWKNNIATPLNDPNNSVVNSLFVYNNDVYVTGNSGYLYPSLWKNNVLSILPNSFNSSSVKSVYVINGIVYACGQDLGRPCYWKNGVRTILPTVSGFGIVNAIFVVGTDVYSTGQDNNSSTGIPVYWKNGTRIALPYNVSYGGAYPNSIFVSGSDVYIAGREGRYGAVVWKNEVMIVMENRNAIPGLSKTDAKSIFVDGSDYYVGGSDESGPYPVLWKNGLKVSLEYSEERGRISSVFVMNSVAYATGYCNQGIAIWKNNTRYNLPRSGQPWAIHVTP